MPVLRVLFIAPEAAFNFVFWAMQSKEDNTFGMAEMCKRGCGTLEYDGLYSHSPLSEIVPGGFSLSAEELEAQAAVFLNRHQEYMHEHFNKTNARDPVKFLARKKGDTAHIP